MKENCRAYKMDFTDELAEFKITDQGESGGESYLMDLNIISAKMRKRYSVSRTPPKDARCSLS